MLMSTMDLGVWGWGGVGVGCSVCSTSQRSLIIVPFAMEHLSGLMFQEKLWETPLRRIVCELKS